MRHSCWKAFSARSRQTGKLVVAALVAAFVVSWVVTPAAQAEAQYRIAWTGIGIYPRSGPSMDSGKVGAALPDGATVSIACELEGQAVSNGYNISTVWERLSDGTHLPNAFMDTGVDGWTPGVPRCDAPPSDVVARVFDGRKAATWAVDRSGIPEKFWNGDCTFFVSQALWVGGLPQTPEWTSYTGDQNMVASHNLPWLNPGPSKAAASADVFKNYIVNAGIGTITELSWRDNTAGGAQLGDIIAYDWEKANHTDGADGFIDHLALVTKLNDQGYPFVTQHTPTQVNRYWSWSNEGNKWIEFAKSGARVYLIHITK